MAKCNKDKDETLELETRGKRCQIQTVNFAIDLISEPSMPMGELCNYAIRTLKKAKRLENNNNTYHKEFD